MIYVEFIARERSTPLEPFHALGAQSAWRDPKDPLLGQITRCLGLGGRPTSMSFCRYDRMARLDEWEAHFRSPAHLADVAMHAKHHAIVHDRAGCYDELVRSERLSEGRYAVVGFAGREGIADPLDRLARAAGARLKIALVRIGFLAPPPGGLAVFALPDARTFERLAREATADRRLAARETGLYVDFGRGDP